MIVHAGIIPNIPLEQQTISDMTKMRNVYFTEKNSIGEASESPDRGGPWAEIWQGPTHIYFGHDARRGLQLHPFATGLDTGCCYGRQLSAVILPGHTIMQVQATTSHAPCKDD